MQVSKKSATMTEWDAYDVFSFVSTVNASWTYPAGMLMEYEPFAWEKPNIQ
jgi:hypothetical protein